MKKILLLTAAVLISGSAMAQHEHFHVFRNDKQFNTFNNVQEITYQGSPSSGYDKMQVTDAKGNTTTIDIEAIDANDFAFFMPQTAVFLSILKR